MDNTSHDTVQSLEATLVQLRATKVDIDAEYQARIADLNRDIDAYERVIARETGADLPPSTTSSENLQLKPVPFTDTRFPRSSQPTFGAQSGGWARRLRGLTQPEALIRIAEGNDGVLRVVDAKRIFLEAKLAKGQIRNVNGHIHHILTRSDRFERIEPGVFRLLPKGRILETPASPNPSPNNDRIEVESPTNRHDDDNLQKIDRSEPQDPTPAFSRP